MGQCIDQQTAVYERVDALVNHLSDSILAARCLTCTLDSARSSRHQIGMRRYIAASPGEQTTPRSMRYSTSSSCHSGLALNDSVAELLQYGSEHKGSDSLFLVQLLPLAGSDIAPVISCKFPLYKHVGYSPYSHGPCWPGT